jgi:hypothetical protein
MAADCSGSRVQSHQIPRGLFTGGSAAEVHHSIETCHKHSFTMQAGGTRDLSDVELGFDAGNAVVEVDDFAD